MTSIEKTTMKTTLVAVIVIAAITGTTTIVGTYFTAVSAFERGNNATNDRITKLETKVDLKFQSLDFYQSRNDKEMSDLNTRQLNTEQAVISYLSKTPIDKNYRK